MENGSDIGNWTSAEVDAAHQVGRELDVMQGLRDSRNESHPSFGFHLHMVRALGPSGIHRALSAVRDAVDYGRGDGPHVDSVSGYFAGVCKKLAERKGVEI